MMTRDARWNNKPLGCKGTPRDSADIPQASRCGWITVGLFSQVVHDIGSEKLFLRDLVSSGAVTDLTGAL